MGKHAERHIFNGEKAKRIAAELKENAEFLSSLVIEMVKDEPRTLLSPVFRNMLVERAELLQATLAECSFAICVDIPDEMPEVTRG